MSAPRRYSMLEAVVECSKTARRSRYRIVASDSLLMDNNSSHATSGLRSTAPSMKTMASHATGKTAMPTHNPDVFASDFPQQAYDEWTMRFTAQS
jgi:hypothetical protein